jgi:hypothetical protein
VTPTIVQAFFFNFHLFALVGAPVDLTIPVRQTDRNLSTRDSWWFSAVGRLVTPGFFNTFEITLLSGRLFQSPDTAVSSRVAILSETAARAVGGVSPIGRNIKLTDGSEPYDVVGVVRDVLYESLRTAAGRMERFRVFKQAEDARLRKLRSQGYSALSATTGSTDAALRTGRYTAHMATRSMRVAHPANVGLSSGVTPYIHPVR